MTEGNVLILFLACLVAITTGQCGCSACSASSPGNTRFCPAGGCSIVIVNNVITSCTCSSGGAACFTSSASCGTAPGSQSALASVSSGGAGFMATATVTFCLSATSDVFLSGDSTTTGTLNVDDMIVYKSDANGVIGASFVSACSTSGFLTVNGASVITGGTGGSGPAISVGTLSAGSHTLMIGTFSCSGTGSNNPINVVGCNVISCSATTTTTTTSSTTSSSSTTSPSSSATVWSGTYSVDNSCSQSICCCVTGTFVMTQVGTSISGNVNVAGQCGGSTTSPFDVTLSSPTSLSGTWGQNNLVKNGAIVTATNTLNAACSGILTCTSGDCLPPSSTCFHESSIITYKGGELLTLEKVQKESERGECHIPHIIRSDGIAIHVSCDLNDKKVLRLTGDHLVFTKAGGLKAASEVSVNDILFSDLEQTRECKVTKTVPEFDQVYFGLNCRESIVLANGIKTSTFGHYHTIPSLWMNYGAKVLGVDRASRWGDSIVKFLNKIKVL